MKHFLRDASQIVLAILITGSMVYANELPQPQAVKNSETTVTETKTEEPTKVEAPKEEPKPVEVAPVAEPTPVPQPVVPAQPAYIPAGNQYDWLLASGIPQEYWRAVDYIVSRESGWKPCAYYPGGNDCNASPSGACGLVQQNPCGKIPGDWRDPVAALKWQYQYVTQRYGGYPQAMQYWQANGHY